MPTMTPAWRSASELARVCSRGGWRRFRGRTFPVQEGQSGARPRLPTAIYALAGSLFIDFMKRERPVAASTTSYIPSTPIRGPVRELDRRLADAHPARLAVAGLLALDDVEVGLAALHHPFVVATVLRRLMTPGEPLVEVVGADQLRHGEPGILGECLVASAELVLRAALPHDAHVAARRGDLAQIAVELRLAAPPPTQSPSAPRATSWWGSDPARTPRRPADRPREWREARPLSSPSRRSAATEGDGGSPAPTATTGGPME